MKTPRGGGRRRRPTRSRGEALPVFELAMLGGVHERRFRKLRPEVEALPWGALAQTELDPELRDRAREVWTRFAYVEHQTAAAISACTTTLIKARAPVDFVTFGSLFVADELSHVDLCTRVLGELGGGVVVGYDARSLYPEPDLRLHPLAQAAELVLRVFCLGEAFSLPMAQRAARDAKHPLISAVMTRIAKDEAPHAGFGWTFFDWALDLVDAPTRDRLRRVVDEVIAAYDRLFVSTGVEPEPTLGWLSPHDFNELGRPVLRDEVLAPLAARGLA